jgi:hypothetical protein
VIAEPKDKSTQKELESEALQYKDMIQFGFIDNYYNMTLKVISILCWTQYKCLDTKYIMKANDIIININLLVKNLKIFRSGITGILSKKRKAITSNAESYYMPKDIYPDQYYYNFLRDVFNDNGCYKVLE